MNVIVNVNINAEVRDDVIVHVSVTFHSIVNFIFDANVDVNGAVNVIFNVEVLIRYFTGRGNGPMYVITFANPKGGSGKTTSAMLLAEQIRRAGGSVAILDCDPNQNIVQWAEMRTQGGKFVPFIVKPVPGEEAFLDTVEGLRGSADYLIIDLEGTASQMVTYAISQSDIVLVPFEPTAMEARQAARAIQLVRNTGRMIGRSIAHALLLTRVNAAFQTSDERDVRRETDNGNVPVIRTAIVRRAAYTRIFREGLLLDELKEMFIAETEGQTKSQQERVLKPVEGAIQNAVDFAQDVMNRLQEKGLAA